MALALDHVVVLAPAALLVGLLSDVRSRFMTYIRITTWGAIMMVLIPRILSMTTTPKLKSKLMTNTWQWLQTVQSPPLQLPYAT